MATPFTPDEIETGRKLFAGDWQFFAAAGSLQRIPPMRGTEIAFSLAYFGTYEGSIWKVRADGTGAGVVRAGGPQFQDPYYSEPAWSPDRTKIAFRWNTPTLSSPSQVSVMNSDGSDATQLTLGVKSSWQAIPNRPPDCFRGWSKPLLPWISATRPRHSWGRWPRRGTADSRPGR